MEPSLFVMVLNHLRMGKAMKKLPEKRKTLGSILIQLQQSSIEILDWVCAKPLIKYRFQTDLHPNYWYWCHLSGSPKTNSGENDFILLICDLSGFVNYIWWEFRGQSCPSYKLLHCGLPLYKILFSTSFTFYNVSINFLA